jgi:CheY-like chemotaxis protein
LRIAWTETGGPSVTPPKRRGFGSVLLSRSIPFDLGGESDIEYAREGVKARLLIPAKFLVSIRAPKRDPAMAPRSNRQATSLTGKRALLVEDQLVIALDAEALLAECGFAGVDTAATSAEALRTLAATNPDIAVLDINLGSGTSFAVAEELERRRIPFVFATGYGDQTMIPQRLKHVPVARKPYDIETLMQALQNAFGDRDA